MLRLVPDHIKTKRMCKHAVKKLPFLIKYVPDRYKTQQMCDKVILENGGILMFFFDSCKDQSMCNKAVGNYPRALRSVLIAVRPKKCVIKYTYPSTIQFMSD